MEAKGKDWLSGGHSNLGNCVCVYHDCTYTSVFVLVIPNEIGGFNKLLKYSFVQC